MRQHIALHSIAIMTLATVVTLGCSDSKLQGPVGLGSNTADGKRQTQNLVNERGQPADDCIALLGKVEDESTDDGKGTDSKGNTDSTGVDGCADGNDGVDSADGVDGGTADGTGAGTADGTGAGDATGSDATGGGADSSDDGNSTGGDPIDPNLIIDDGGVNDGYNFLAVTAGKTGGPRVTTKKIAIPLIAISSPDFFAFDQNTRDGAQVAVGDFDGDNVADLAVSAGEGQPSHVKITSKVGADKWGYFAFGAPTDPLKSGVSLAACDFNGDGKDDLVMGAWGAGMAPHVKIYLGAREDMLYDEFFAFDQNLRNGVEVGCGDIDGNGRAELLVAQARSAAPVVEIYAYPNNVRAHVTTISGIFEPSFTGGASLAAGDIDGDGRDDVIVGAGTTGSPRVVIFKSGDQNARLADFMAFDQASYPPEQFRFGLDVAAIKRTPKMPKALLIVCAGFGGSAHVRIFRSDSSGAMSNVIANDIMFEDNFRGGAFCAARGMHQ